MHPESCSTEAWHRPTAHPSPLPCKGCRASATGYHPDEVYAAQMGEEKAILANLLIFNSAFPFKLLLQQDRMRRDITTANLKEHLPPTWPATNMKGSLCKPQLFCTFKMHHQFAALLTGSGKNSKGKPTSY